VILLRPLAHLVGFLWAVLLALLCLGIALFCLDGLISLGSARPDRLLHLPRVRVKVGHLLTQLEAPGHAAILTLLCGLGAMLVGLALAYGLLGRGREQLAVLEGEQSAADGSEGMLGARRRTLGQVGRVLAGATDDVLAVKRVRVRLRRGGGGGRLRVRTIRARGSEESVVNRSVEEALTPITDPFALRGGVASRRRSERSDARG
jgi:hypothetical protein